MKRYLLDTDTFTHYLHDHPKVVTRVIRELSSEVNLSVITVEEVWGGWMAKLNRAKTPREIGAAYHRLAETVDRMRQWNVISFDVVCATRYLSLRKMKLNGGNNDLKIGAIALERNATVVTCNRRDFARIPGVVTEAWTI